MKPLLHDSLDTTVDETELAEASAALRCLQNSETKTRIADYLAANKL